MPTALPLKDDQLPRTVEDLLSELHRIGRASFPETDPFLESDVVRAAAERRWIRVNPDGGDGCFVALELTPKGYDRLGIKLSKWKRFMLRFL